MFTYDIIQIGDLNWLRKFRGGSLALTKSHRTQKVSSSSISFFVLLSSSLQESSVIYIYRVKESKQCLKIPIPTTDIIWWRSLWIWWIVIKVARVHDTLHSGLNGWLQ